MHPALSLYFTGARDDLLEALRQKLSTPTLPPLSAGEGERLDALDSIVSDLILLNPTPKPGSTLGYVALAPAEAVAVAVAVALAPTLTFAMYSSGLRRWLRASGASPLRLTSPSSRRSPSRASTRSTTRSMGRAASSPTCSTPGWWACAVRYTCAIPLPTILLQELYLLQAGHRRA